MARRRGGPSDTRTSEEVPIPRKEDGSQIPEKRTANKVQTRQIAAAFLGQDADLSKASIARLYMPTSCRSITREASPKVANFSIICSCALRTGHRAYLA